MIVAGLDLSLTATGIVVLDEGGKILLEDTIKVKASIKGMKRLHQIKKVLATYPFIYPGLGLVVIEGYAYHGMSKATYQIGELGGVIRLMLWENKIPYIEVAPQALKKFVTGKGNTKKDMMPKAVLIKWGFDAPDSHCADAFALARWGLEFGDMPPILTAKKRKRKEDKP